jgi:hypothetical protein
MAIWLSRDKSGWASAYLLFDKKPQMNEDGDYGVEGPDPIFEMCVKKFHRAIKGMKPLKPGEIRRVKRIVFEFTQ